MKFFSKLIFLVASASLCVNSKIIKREIKLTVNENNVMTDQACQNDLLNSDEYKNCYKQTITLENYKELCTVLNSTKCQNFFKNPMSYLPNCVDDKELSELLSPTMITNTLSSVHLICQTDEQDGLCPIAEALLKKKKIKEKTIKKSCKSKNCINSAIEVYSSLQNNLSGFEQLSITTGSQDDTSKNNIVSVIDYLNSKECQEGPSSGATTIKLGSSIILTLGLLLFSLY